MTEPDQRYVVVDTNVVSYIHRGDPIARQYLDRMAGCHAIASFQTLAELLYGAFSSNWGRRRITDLVKYIDENYIVLGCSERLIVTCAKLRASHRRLGLQLDAADAWIAATAVLLNCPLLSHDRDFGGLAGLEVISYL